jgi:cyclase
MGCAVLKKRLIGVITVRRGWAVQSFGYRRWLPLGRPEVLAQNLDRWGVDEIFVQAIDRSAARSGPDLELLARLGRMGLSTPLIYGGGIATLADANRAVSGAADRVCVDVLLRDDPREVERISRHLGAQAVIGALPLARRDGALCWFDHRDRSEAPLAPQALELFRAGVVSEALLIDWRNEGSRAGFDESLLEAFPVAEVPLIAFGGLSEPVQLRRVLGLPRVSAAALGNFLNYAEHAVQHYRQQLAGVALRPADYRAMGEP